MAAFPIKIEGASAGWVRAVAILEALKAFSQKQMGIVQRPVDMADGFYLSAIMTMVGLRVRYNGAGRFRRPHRGIAVLENFEETGVVVWP